MSQASLEEPVASLERIVAELVAKTVSREGEPIKDWRSTIGMFDNDPIMKEIIEEGRKIREADRKRVREIDP